METTPNIKDRDLFFAYAHGIRMTMDALGIPFDVNSVQPLLKKMDDVLGNAKHSLIKGSDQVPDWDEFNHLRKLEQQLFLEYIKEVLSVVDDTERKNDKS
jgi:hypothetical protein